MRREAESLFTAEEIQAMKAADREINRTFQLEDSDMEMSKELDREAVCDAKGDRYRRYKQYQRAYYQKNKERYREWNQKYYRENRERILKQQAEYLDKHRQENNDRCRRYYYQHHERMLELSRLNRQKKKMKTEAGNA